MESLRASTRKLLPERVIRLLRQRPPMSLTKAEWEQEYRRGDWDYLRTLDELPHYTVIAGYVHSINPTAAVLDVGCGEGILQEHLGADGYSHYAGIDLSEAAIARAAEQADERTTFLSADAASYVPDREFDCIVFNEVLYYLPDPLAVVRRYQASLSADGAFIVSMFIDPRCDVVWQSLEADFTAEATIDLVGGRVGWRIKILRPAPLLPR
jgi:2-polyprenyl-3-methyl-5-hydroxy-6-metoxy-1,4-benzoquinol methylase